MIKERYSNLIDSDQPLYTDVEGALYMQNRARGFYIFGDAAPKIEKTSENGFSLLAGYDIFCEVSTADIRIVSSEGAWKISGISFGI